MSVTLIESSISFDSNIWLVKGSSAIIIDSGTGLASDEVIGRIESELGPLDVSAVVLTHCHFDHTGGANALSAAFSCPIFLGTGDYDAISKADRVTTVADFFLDSGSDLMPVDCTGVSEGYVFDIGEYRLRVIETPGHTPGGICLYDEIGGSLFSGDTLFANGIGRVDLPGGSLRSMADSLLRLRNVNITTLYPGHGPAETDGTGSLAYALHSVGLS